MPRPLRFVPEHSMVEVTTRTLHGRLLLKPSPELTELVLGIVGKAQALYGMTIHAFVFLSTHAHFLLSPTDAGQLAVFMQFINANVAKEAGRLYDWRERVWSRPRGWCQSSGTTPAMTWSSTGPPPSSVAFVAYARCM